MLQRHLEIVTQTNTFYCIFTELYVVIQQNVTHKSKSQRLDSIMFAAPSRDYHTKKEKCLKHLFLYF